MNAMMLNSRIVALLKKDSREMASLLKNAEEVLKRSRNSIDFWRQKCLQLYLVNDIQLLQLLSGSPADFSQSSPYMWDGVSEVRVVDDQVVAVVSLNGEALAVDVVDFDLIENVIPQLDANIKSAIRTQSLDALTELGN